MSTSCNNWYCHRNTSVNRSVRDIVQSEDMGPLTSNRWVHVSRRRQNKLFLFCLLFWLAEVSNLLFSHFFLLDGILFCLLFEPMMGRGGALSHCDGGMSTALSPASLRGQGMGFYCLANIYRLLATRCSQIYHSKLLHGSWYSLWYTFFLQNVRITYCCV